MFTDNPQKVSSDHLRRDAYLYVRQSSLRLRLWFPIRPTLFGVLSALETNAPAIGRYPEDVSYQPE